jgi:tetratricopeptide (TPR) repeat protein
MKTEMETETAAETVAETVNETETLAPPAASARNAAALLELGRKRLELFDIDGYQDAVACFRAALEADESCGSACVGLAEAFAYWGFRRELEGEDAEASYALAYRYAEKALALAAQEGSSHRAMAVALRRGARADAERRRAESSAAVELDPADADNWYEYWRAFGYGLADSSIRKALSLNPSHFAAYHDVAVALCEQGRLPEAEKWMRMALEIHPRHSLALYNLAMIAERQGRAADALAGLRAAGALFPGNRLIHDGMAALAERVDG